MASGDLTIAEGPTYCETEAELTTAINAMNLATTTDFLVVIPWRNGAMAMSVERTA